MININCNLFSLVLLSTSDIYILCGIEDHKEIHDDNLPLFALSLMHSILFLDLMKCCWKNEGTETEKYM